MLQPGDTLNHGAYRIVQKLGAGGSSMVYLAEDLRLRQHVAIKTILPEVVTRDPGASEAFYDEACLAAGLDHAHIIPIHYVGEEEIRGWSLRYIVMQYMEGGDLETVLEQDAWDLRQRLSWIYHIAEGLAYAHQQGVIQRDLKPRNIFLTKNHNVKIGDFGLAKAVGSETKTVLKGVGTPAYISPEQVQGRSADCRSDIYSFGIICYQMLTSRLPYDAPGVTDSHNKIQAIFYQHNHAPIPSARAANPEIPPQLDILIQRMMAKEPADRPSSADEIAHEIKRMLDRIENGQPRRLDKRLVMSLGFPSMIVIFFVLARFVPFLPAPLSLREFMKSGNDELSNSFKWLREMIHDNVKGEPMQSKAAETLRQQGIDLTVLVNREGIVTLSGVVEAAQHREQAIRLAREISGGMEVRDHIRLPHEIQAEVAKELQADGLQLKVDVSPDGIVTLTGVVQTREQKERAISLARVPDVKDVKANINAQDDWAQR